MSDSFSTIMKNSYKDLHTKGLDYVCIRRSAQETIKYYFFDNEILETPEVVSPHDHRYAFTTMVMHGEMENILYEVNSMYGKKYFSWNWYTSLNGGKGFAPYGTAKLNATGYANYKPGQIYAMNFGEVHTIKIKKPNTVLRLTQYADQLDLSAPTRTFTLTGKMPSIKGVYNKFSRTELEKRLEQIAMFGMDYPIDGF